MAKSDAFPKRKRPFEAAAACAFARSATSSRATSAASASRERAASWALMAAVSRASSSTNMIGLFLFVRRPKSFQTFSYGPASSEVVGLALGWRARARGSTPEGRRERAAHVASIYVRGGHRDRAGRLGARVGC
jgi:hypothetical protein